MVYTSEYPIISVTVDVVCLTVRRGDLQVLLVERGSDPFEGKPAFPGGFVDVDEDLEQAARRELREETALENLTVLEQLATYGRPDRDPRGRTISVAHLAVAADPGEVTAGDDAAKADWHPVATVLENPETLAFDHAEILRDALERARDDLERTPSAARLCGPRFTLADLRHVYEAVWGSGLDPAGFEAQVTDATGFLVETGEVTEAAGRPAALYRRGDATRIRPPLDLRALSGARPLPGGSAACDA